MRIQSIQIYPCSQVCRANVTNNQKKIIGDAVKPKKPLSDGLSTFGAWFGFGVGLDLVSRKCQFFKSPMKNSLVINGLIASGAGLLAYIHDKKNS